MNLYKLYQCAQTGYDVYDSAVVAAEDENSARKIHPRTFRNGMETNEDNWRAMLNDDWAFNPDQVFVEYLGVAKEGTAIGVIIASFNAS